MMVMITMIMKQAEDDLDCANHVDSNGDDDDRVMIELMMMMMVRSTGRHRVQSRVHQNWRLEMIDYDPDDDDDDDDDTDDGS